eukprot:CAMPEP_0179200136 /NCGR_PEP_ID=MMETSP0796-20121207/99581_1 /TAXON_ID=73915 /ORGANISM="Pyrodinium bahamense, Strain pbaha01" /LENGTH=42 /DNA_ID= /DNA_START= /DNA_END= /DNA_ORIENTATION=
MKCLFAIPAPQGAARGPSVCTVALRCTGGTWQKAEMTISSHG